MTKLEDTPNLATASTGSERMLSKAREKRYSQALDLLAEKLPLAEKDIGIEFPYISGQDGRWQTLPATLSAGYQSDGTWSHGNWFSGFWVGLLVAAHLHTGDQRLMDWARARMALVALRADDRNTHDIGFIFQSSAVALFHVLGEAPYRDLALRAASALRSRLVTTRAGGFISSWGPIIDPRGRRSSAIDTMANLWLLYWAAEAADDGSFRQVARAHADTTAAWMVRSDHSTCHAVEYDLGSGARTRAYTFQGYADDSCWPRGQAWAIYGFVETARATGVADYLDQAGHLADYYLRRTGGGGVPAWDFDAPRGDAEPKDSSAAAIAAAGLLGLAGVHPDRMRANAWREAALSMLDRLCTDYIKQDPGDAGLLRHGVYSMPHGVGTDCSVMFGDYYFVESLMAVLHPGSFRPLPEMACG